jgi:hypothetical protein
MTAMNAAVETAVCPIAAYDHLTQARQILHWVEAVNWAAQEAKKAGFEHRASTLVNLGQYLADDWANHFDCQAEQLANAHGLKK